jgi:hypothetical protein
MWVLYLVEEQEVQVSENEVLRKTFGYWKDEVSEQFMMLYNAFCFLVCYFWKAFNFPASQGCENTLSLKVRLKCVFEVVTFHITFNLLCLEDLFTTHDTK